LTAIIRLWLPLFFLRRCVTTTAAADAAKEALTTNTVSDARVVSARLIGANTILRGSKNWLSQLAPIIQSYVRARLELSILLDLSNLCEWLTVQGVNPTNPLHYEKVKQRLSDFEVDPGRAKNLPFPEIAGNFFAAKKLSMPGDKGDGRLPFDLWLAWVVKNKPSLDSLAKAIGADDTTDLIEKVYAHVRPEYEPLKSGFGKNALEYVAFALGAPRKSDRDPEFPDEFNLLFRGEGGRRSRQIQVQPGPQLLTVLVQLVSYEERERFQTTAKLSDLLDLLDALGIDYRANPEDFEGLKSDLLRLGLLQSSADAAEAASLNPPYSFRAQEEATR
jgi:hypothetical protein